MLSNNGFYEIMVRPLGRTIADEYYHNGSVWIEGREGNNYTIDLRNNTPQQALFIVSVDGLDILEGKPAGVESKGYVVGANSSISIPGWKINGSEAAEFYFSRSRDSYVNSIGGNTTNTGVIGTLVFSEKFKVPDITNFANLSTMSWNGIPPNMTTWQAPIESASTLRVSDVRRINAQSKGLLSESTSETVVASASQDIGTGFGSATAWNTRHIEFERANPKQPDALLALYYNTAKNLEKMGIRLKTKRDISYQANPFPVMSTTTGGCQLPPGYKK
jgi:hypothetical protein